MLVPAIIASIFNLGLIAISISTILDFANSILLLNYIPDSGLENLPFQFYSMYADSINLILILLFASIVSGYWLLFVYCKYINDAAKKNAGLAKSTVYGFKNLKKIIGLSILSIAILLFFATAGWFVLILSMGFGIIGTILVAVLSLLIAYCGIKLVFVPTIMGADGVSFKDALKKSWEFSGKRFFRIIFLLLALGVIGFFINSIGTSLASYFNESQEIFYIGTVLIFMIIATAYSNVALIIYYLKKEHNLLP